MHAGLEQRAQFAVERRMHRRTIAHDERQLERAELGHRPGEAHRGDVAGFQLAGLDHRRQVARRAPEVEHVADEFELHAILAQARGKPFTEAARRLVVDGRRHLVAAEADADRCG